MSNDEAKFILSAYRPNGADAADEALAGALQQARQDPALAAWFARQQAHDAAIAAKVTEVVPPAGLREAILAGARVSDPRRSLRGNWPWWLGLAAAVALIAGLATRTSAPAADAKQLTAFALTDAREPSPHGGHGEPAKALQVALSGETKLEARLPIDFAALAHTGCRTLNLAGETVLEVCFNHEGTWLHCYIVRCADFPRLPAAAQPTYAAAGSLNAVTWADGTYRYVVAGPVAQGTLERLL